MAGCWAGGRAWVLERLQQPDAGLLFRAAAGHQVMWMQGPKKENDGHEGGTHKKETGDRCW